MARAPASTTIGAVFGRALGAVVAQSVRARRPSGSGLTLVTTRVARRSRSGARCCTSVADEGRRALAARRHRRRSHAQVFQYALRLQLERGLPRGRGHAPAGALGRAGGAPTSARAPPGRIAAELANRYLEGRNAVIDVSELDLYSARAHHRERAGRAPSRHRRSSARADGARRSNEPNLDGHAASPRRRFRIARVLLAS